MTGDTALYRFVLLIAAVVILVPLLLLGTMFVTMGGMMGGGMMGGGAMGAPLVTVAVLPLLLALLFLYGGYRLARGIDTEASEHEAHDSVDPIEQLQKEYVAGDMTEAEFEARLEEQFDRDADRATDRFTETTESDRSREIERPTRER